VHYLKHDEQLVVESATERWTIDGPGRKVTNPLFSISVRKATLLDEQQYVHLKDGRTGTKRAVHGPGIAFLGPYESALNNVSNAIHIDKDTAVRVLDTASGRQRLVTNSGAAAVGRFFPLPTEAVLEVQKLVRVEPHQVVIVQDADGLYHFFGGAADAAAPTPAHTTSTHTAPTHTAATHTAATHTATATSHGAFGVIKSSQVGSQLPSSDGEGELPAEPTQVTPTPAGVAASGALGTAFFLQPHWKLITMSWSSAIDPHAANDAAAPVHTPGTLAYKQNVTKVDLRARYTSFEYRVRTLDNVELVLQGTIFWQVTHVPTMISATGDPVGDVFYHARSALIQAVSAVKLTTFMTSFNALVADAAATDTTFYAARGVRLHSLEVTSYRPADDATALVLQKIISETTNRINRLQQQRSQNEVERSRLDSEVLIEQARQELERARAQNQKQALLDRAAAAAEVDQLKLRAELALETSCKLRRAPATPPLPPTARRVVCASPRRSHASLLRWAGSCPTPRPSSNCTRSSTASTWRRTWSTPRRATSAAARPTSSSRRAT